MIPRLFAARIKTMRNTVFEDEELASLYPSQLVDYTGFLASEMAKAQRELEKSGYHP